MNMISLGSRSASGTSTSVMRPQPSCLDTDQEGPYKPD